MRRAWLLGLWLASSAAVVHAQPAKQAAVSAQPAKPSTSSLSWVRLAGAESCVSTQRLAERVEKRLGRRAFVSASQADLSFEGRIEHAHPRGLWIATVVVSDRDGRILGRRELHASGDDCAAIENSLVLVLAIAIDPGGVMAAVLGPDDKLSDQANQLLSQLELPRANDADLLQQLTIPRPSAAGATSQATVVTKRVTSSPHHSGTSRLARSEWWLAWSATTDFGLLPRTALGSALAVSHQRHDVGTIEVFVFGYLPRNAAIATQDAPATTPWSADYRLYGIGARLCPWSIGAASAQLGLCGGARLGALSVHGEGFAQELTSTRAWAQLELQARLGVTLGRFGLQLSGGPGASLVRDRLQFEDAAGAPQTFYRPAVLSGALSLGASVRLD